MNEILNEFIKKVPAWARILALLGMMFLSGFIFHSKVMADLDEKMTERLKSSPALMATVEIKTQLLDMQKFEDIRFTKTENRLDSIDGDIKQILRGQQGIIIQANSIQAHAQVLKKVAQNIHYDTKTIKEDTQFIKENTLMKKRK